MEKYSISWAVKEFAFSSLLPKGSMVGETSTAIPAAYGFPMISYAVSAAVRYYVSERGEIQNSIYTKSQ